MKYDGHVKLTLQAISRMKKQCPVNTGSCSAPMFEDDFRMWFGDKNKSTPVDNYTSAIFNYILNGVTPDKISTVKLPDAVAFVDLDERWTHDDPAGQRYHFMKAKGENNIKAYNNATDFIYKHTLNWVETSRKILKYESAVYKDKIVRPLQNSGLGLNNYYVKELALALHSLQDSFSPAHTQRYQGGKRLVTQTVHDLKKSDANIILPIRNLYEYSSQDKEKHGSHDYHSGGPVNNWGEIAIRASADLMTMGINSLWKDDVGISGWNAFKARWLASNFV